MKKTVHYSQIHGIPTVNESIYLVADDHPDFSPGRLVLTSTVINVVDGVIETKNTFYAPTLAKQPQ